MKIIFFTILAILSFQGIAKDEKFVCSGVYDKYDDTCYHKDGSFEHYNFVDGQRKERGFGFYGWRNGYYAGFVPHYWYYPRSSGYVPDGVRNRRVHGRDERRRRRR